ncbi:unnamed protein product (macronuclear) [Paramecium tetraurelia]|uniref:Uncharacterized protein n=1 Tax=Paramecium tetraurelia TaxID=5888 RepID=A0ECF6_PARTE|nr:uncharacterized protein GSPATT00003842001 [Paramecium tetraurelia]CAK92973.1 unnamed protein product [Paramecium tetraurelia]|eukprot:XP_001460370.1 hypothetical protein (macronuclear) [Paramecium tetraurelia strain d4-2]
MKDEIKGKGFGFFKAICLAKRLALINYNTEDITYLQDKYGTLQYVKQQRLYYPTLKQKILFQNKIQIWKIKYKDLTADKNFIVLYVSQEGNSYNFFSFDLPVVSKGREKNGAKIWPTVVEALRELDEFKYNSQIFNFEQYKKDKYSFISGLTQRAKVKINAEDINICSYVQSYLCQFHQPQISKIKKICGYAYEILPNINQTTFNYINMNLINKIISIEKMHFHNKQSNIIDNITDKELQDYLYSIVQVYLYFQIIYDRWRTISESQRNFLKDIFNCYQIIQNKCFQKFVLLTLEIGISKDLKYHLNDILSPERKKGNSLNIPQVFGQRIQRQYFELKVSSYLFNKEKVVDNIKSNLLTEPYSLQISLYHQLLEYLEKDPQQLQNIRFESLSLFLFTYFELNLIQNKIILKNDNQLKTKENVFKINVKGRKKHLIICHLTLKTMILSKHKDMTNHFNSNHYRFFINRNQQFIAIHLYITVLIKNQIILFLIRKEMNEYIILMVKCCMQIYNQNCYHLKLLHLK